MKNRWFIVSVLVLLAGALSIAIAQRHGRGGDWGIMGMQKYVQRLNLTPEQQQQIRQIIGTRRQAAEPDMKGAGDLRATLAKQVFVDQPNAAQIQQTANQLKLQMSKMIDEYVAAGMDVNKVLTAEQRSEVQKIIEERRTKSEQRMQRWKERKQQRQQQSAPNPGN